MHNRNEWIKCAPPFQFYYLHIKFGIPLRSARGSSFTLVSIFRFVQEFPSLFTCFFLLLYFYDYYYDYYYYPALFIIRRKKASDFCTKCKLHSVSQLCLFLIQFFFLHLLLTFGVLSALFSSFILYLLMQKKKSILMHRGKKKTRNIWMNIRRCEKMCTYF